MYNHKRIQTYYSVLGAYSYDKDLFSNFSLHEDIDIDKESLIDYIIYENADFPLQVMNIDLLKVKIGLWCKKNKENWLRIYEALYQKYNPLHNFDRYEELSDETDDTYNKSVSGSSTNTKNLMDTYNLKDKTTFGKKITTDISELTNEDNTGTETNEHENTAFNAGVSLTARDTITKNLSDTIEKDTHDVAQESGTETLDKTGTLKTNGSDDGNYTDSESGDNNRTYNHEGHLWGNIGVTTSQRMLLDELDVRINNNFYDILSNQFKTEFCIMIY